MLDFELPRFGLRQFEQIIDQLERRVNGTTNSTNAFDLFVGQRAHDALLQKLRVAVGRAKRIPHVVGEAAHETRATLGDPLDLLSPAVSLGARVSLSCEQTLTLLIAPLPLRDIGQRPNPANDLSKVVALGNRLPEEPAVFARRPAKPILDRV